MDVEEAQVETTAMLIREEGMDVVLRRLPAPTPDGEGGTIIANEEDRVDLPAKRLYFGSTREIADHRRLPAGDQLVTQHVLIGMPADDIQTTDKFTLWGHDFKVDYIQPDRRYQTKAFVSRHASP